MVVQGSGNAVTQQQRSFDAIVAREQGLRHALTSGQMAMIAIGGAIGTGLFLGSGFAIGLAGPSVLVSYAIGALIALLLMGALAEMTVAHPTAGSFGAYAEHYVGPLAGFLVRYAYWFAVVFAIGTEISAIAVFMKYWFPAVPGWYWVIGFSALLIAVNLASVTLYGTVEYAFSLLKIAAIVVFIVLGAYLVWAAPAASGIGFANYTAHGGFMPKGPWGTWVAVIVAIFSYMSIEAVAIAAGEARDPQHAVTRAFRSTVFRLVLFYLLTLSLMLAIVPWTQAGTDESPFVKVMAATHVPYAAGVINFVLLIAALSAMNSQLYVTTRMMFSLSRAPRARSVRPARRERRAARGAVDLDERRRGGGRAGRGGARHRVHRDDGDRDVRRAVHVADDLRHALAVPLAVSRPRTRIPDVGAPVRQPARRGARRGDPADDRLHARIPDDDGGRRRVRRAADARLRTALPAPARALTAPVRPPTPFSSR